MTLGRLVLRIKGRQMLLDTVIVSLRGLLLYAKSLRCFFARMQLVVELLPNGQMDRNISYLGSRALSLLSTSVLRSLHAPRARRHTLRYLLGEG